MLAKTLFEKLWEQHVVHQDPDGRALLYIDLHLVHEVTSPQAFEGLRLNSLRVRRPELTIATVDHNVPTTPNRHIISDPIAAQQIETLRRNCRDFGVQLFDIDSTDQGIVHVIGPELGLTQPGKTIVCGDSHTSTHGAFGALAFGIGTSEVEHVLATQCLPQRKPKTMLIEVKGKLAEGVTAKDLVLGILGKIGTDGATGHVVEYAGEAVRALSMEGRMTVCNMSIEAGARAGMIAPDETTFAYIKGRPFAPNGTDWDAAVARWQQLTSDHPRFLSFRKCAEQSQNAQSKLLRSLLHLHRFGQRTIRSIHDAVSFNDPMIQSFNDSIPLTTFLCPSFPSFCG